MAATQQEVASPRVLHRLSRRSIDEASEPVISPVEMSDDEEYDEEALARLADSIQSEGGRSRKHVSWNAPSQGRRSGSLDPTIRQTLPSRRSFRPSLQMTDSREGGSDTRGRSQQREADTDDGWRASENPTTSTSRRLSESRASRRSASLVFLGFWALFSVGTLVGNRSGLPSASSVSVGRVLAPADSRPPGTFDPPKAIRSGYEPEGPSWVEILADTVSTNGEDPPPQGEDPPIQQVIGRISAWICAILYLTSRLPQIWKNVSTTMNAASSTLTCRPSSSESLSRVFPCTFSSLHSLETRSTFCQFLHLLC